MFYKWQGEEYEDRMIKREHGFLWLGRLDIVKRSVLSYVIYIPIKVQASCFVDIEKLIVKSWYEKAKRPRESTQYWRRTKFLDWQYLITRLIIDFPGGSVVKNPSTNAIDRSLIPGPGRSRMPWSNCAHEPQQLSLCFRAQESQLPKPGCPRAHVCNKKSQHSEKPVHFN